MTTRPMQMDQSDTAIPGLWWKLLCGGLMFFVIYGAFFVAKGAVNFVGTGDVARIIFFHVPVAIQCSLWYFVGAYYSLKALLAQELQPERAANDWKAATSMELGFVASILATITGSIFAHVQWDSYWNWDPREISIVGLMLIYASYLVLRGAVASDAARRAQLSAVYAVVTVIPATFLIWVVPRIPALQSLHPPNVILDANGTSPTYKVVLYASFISFTMLFVWLFQLRLRALKLTARAYARIVQ